MASSNGTITHYYKGKKYTKELAAQDTNKVNQYVQQIKNEYSNKSTAMKLAVASGSLDATIYRDAVKKERADRVAAAKKQIETENATKLQKSDAPNDVVPNGGVASGDAGISQRKTVADDSLSGMKSDGTDATPSSVRTDADRIASLPTLADTLNDIVYAYPRDGFVTAAIEPSGEGTYFDQIVDMAYKTSGHGGQNYQLAQIFKNIDRFERSLAPRPAEQTGYTFITRPRLNLSDVNLAADRRFTAMRTESHEDVAFALRCMLDTQFCKDNYSAAKESLIDVKSPFATLLCNSCTSISGFQDPILATETTDGGFFQESQSYAIGGDRMARGYDFSLTFRDYPGNPVMAAFDYWYQYMMNLMDGTMIQYADAIDANRLDYTVSIYRFIVDRSKRMVTKWSKCTGCFPTNSPVGVPFNRGQNESQVTANDNFGINFKVNHVGYTNDPLILHEFNMLVRRYLGVSSRSGMNYKAYDYDAQNNFKGTPYIRIGDYGYELVFLRTDTSDTLVPHSSSAALPRVTML